MAVYTKVPDDELEKFILEYDIGELVFYKGIAEGVENSNYLLQTSLGNFILTIYEKRVNPEDLPFFLGLMNHLSEKGISCPTPIKGRDGVALRNIMGKPAALSSFLTGMWPKKISVEHCAELGTAMANMHLAGADFEISRDNNFSINCWRELINNTIDKADGVIFGLSDVLKEEIEFLEREWVENLPKGIIHADIFPDNVFFLGKKLSGIIDFYFACNDFFAYDLAIAINAWCFEEDYSFNVTKSRKLLLEYCNVRSLTDAEINALPILARGSALRFLLTRLYDWINTPKDAMVNIKNPKEYLEKLRFHARVSSAAAYGIY